MVWCLFRGGDAACFRFATAWRRNIFYGKTLHSLRWQPETNECVSATGFVKMRVRILTSCKNRVKHYINKKKGQEAFKQHKKDSGRIREMRLGRVGSCRHLRGRIALQAKLSLLPAMGAVIYNYDTASLGYPGENRPEDICRRSGNCCGVGGGCRLRVGKRGYKRAEAKKTAFSGFLPPRVITFLNFQTWAKHKKAYFCSGQA